MHIIKFKNMLSVFASVPVLPWSTNTFVFEFLVKDLYVSLCVSD